MSKFKFASLGSVSTGTMRPQDLIPEFAYTLRRLGHRSTELTRIERVMPLEDNHPYWYGPEASEDLETLFGMLDAHAPELAYFGAHPGDGSDYGFWVDTDDLVDCFDGLKVDDTSEVPGNYRGLVLHVNDHGNMTLYLKTARKFTEVWSVV